MLGKLALAARSSSDKRFLSDISIGLTTAHDTGFISMTVSLKLDYKISTVDLLYRQRRVVSARAHAHAHAYTVNAAKLCTCIVRRWFLGFSLVACPFN